MKKTNIMQFAAIAIMIATAGCQLIKGDPNRPGYQEGRTAAFAYVMTEPVQPEEVNEVIRAGYQLLDTIFADGSESPIDAVIMTQIMNAYPDATPEFHAFVFNFYQMGFNRLMGEVDLHPDIPAPDVIKNFLQGVKDSLKDWKGLSADTAAAIE